MISIITDITNIPIYIVSIITGIWVISHYDFPDWRGFVAIFGGMALYLVSYCVAEWLNS